MELQSCVIIIQIKDSKGTTPQFNIFSLKLVSNDQQS